MAATDKTISLIIALAVLVVIILVIVSSSSSIIKEIKDMVSEVFTGETAEEKEIKQQTANSIYNGIFAAFNCILGEDICCEITNMYPYDSDEYKISLFQNPQKKSFYLTLEKTGEEKPLQVNEIPIENLYYIKDKESEMEFVEFTKAEFAYGKYHGWKRLIGQVDPPKFYIVVNNEKLELAQSGIGEDKYWSLYKAPDSGKIGFILERAIKNLKISGKCISKELNCRSEYNPLIQHEIDLEKERNEGNIGEIRVEFIRALLEKEEIFDKEDKGKVRYGTINIIQKIIEVCEELNVCDASNNNYDQKRFTAAILKFDKEIIRKAKEKAAEKNPSPGGIYPEENKWDVVKNYIGETNEEGKEYRVIINNYVNEIIRLEERYFTLCKESYSASHLGSLIGGGYLEKNDPKAKNSMDWMRLLGGDEEKALNVVENTADRKGNSVSYIVLHHTGGGGNLKRLIEILENRGLSVHYGVDKKGNIAYIAPEERSAWHAGCNANDPRCKCPGINSQSIGIEIINKGDGRDPYPESQIEAVDKLVTYLVEKYNINPKTSIMGHGCITTNKMQEEPKGFKPSQESKWALNRPKENTDACGITTCTDIT